MAAMLADGVWRIVGTTGRDTQPQPDRDRRQEYGFRAP